MSLAARMKMTPERPQKAPRYGRSDTISAARWFWEIDKVLVILVAVLIAIGLIAVAAASPAAGQRLSGDGNTVAPLYYFYKQLMWIAVAIPVMIFCSMLPKQRARRLCLLGAALLLVALFLVPVTECGVLTTAVSEAAEAAKAGEVVLLSPACSSFDQFRDYEARGEAFREAVGALS